MTSTGTALLPQGCKLLPLVTHHDERGALTEIYRQQWLTDDRRVQWNLVHSKPGTLRGVHAHTNRVDYLLLVSGVMLLGLYDLRRSSETFGRSALVTLTPESNVAAYIPTGVAHGFYFPEPSTTFYGLSDYFSMADELGCHPGDPGLGIPWPAGDWILSDRDRTAGTLAEMQRAFDEKCHR